VNTDRDILKVGPAISGGLAYYYMCYDGVWFVSTSPTGPWTLAESIPKAIYEIPISSPAYRVTHVTVESADDEAVVYAADAAYAGVMVAWGCAVWGTGWNYAPYVGWARSGPVYYPRHPSYGYGVTYDPRSGSYARGGLSYGPYGGVGHSARYNQRTGTDSRGVSAGGPGVRVYGRWESTAVERGDRWAKASRFMNRATGATPATQGRGGEGTSSRRGPEGGTLVAQMASGNLFAGYDGDVYRNQGGSWQKYERGGWIIVGASGRPGARAQQYSDQDGLSAETRDQLNHDFLARRDGDKRMSAGAVSYRPARDGSRRDDKS